MVEIGLNLKTSVKSKNSTGFTLLELLLVLAIIGMASALVIPQLNSEVKLFDAQVRELIAVLKYNRRMAVVKNQVQHARLHPFNADKKKTKQKKGQWYSRGAEYIWKTADINKQLKNKPLSIDFFPQGGATKGELLIYFNDIKNIIQIDGFTGKVSLKDVEDNDF